MDKPATAPQPGTLPMAPRFWVLISFMTMFLEENLALVLRSAAPCSNLLIADFNEPSYHKLLSRPSFQHVSAVFPHSKNTCRAPIYDSHRLQILRAGRSRHVPFGIRMNSAGSAITQADRDYMNLALNLALKGQVTPTAPQPFPAFDRCTSRTRTRTQTRSQARKRART